MVSRRSHFRLPRHKATRYGKKVIVGLVGGVVTAIGIAMLALPGPALIVIPLGLSILAAEFAWARRAKRQVEHRARRVAIETRRRLQARNRPPRVDTKPERRQRRVDVPHGGGHPSMLP